MSISISLFETLRINGINKLDDIICIIFSTDGYRRDKHVIFIRTSKVDEAFKNSWLFLLDIKASYFFHMFVVCLMFLKQIETEIPFSAGTQRQNNVITPSFYGFDVVSTSGYIYNKATTKNNFVRMIT